MEDLEETNSFARKQRGDVGGRNSKMGCDKSQQQGWRYKQKGREGQGEVTRVSGSCFSRRIGLRRGASGGGGKDGTKFKGRD